MKTLRELMQTSRVEKVPRGWYTVHAFAKQQGYATYDGKFYRALKFGLEQGFVEMRKFSIRSLNGARSTPHYRRVK